MARELDDNQLYYLLRRSVVYYFSKQAMSEEYYVTDFKQVMDFTTRLYKSYIERKVDVQKC